MAVEVMDRIEKKVFLRGPRERVWRAVANAEEFGKWFGVDLQGRAFAPGAIVRGPVLHENYRHLTWEATVEEVVPEKRISWRWHPSAIDVNRDYSKESTTLVVFELADAPGGTTLTVTESGFGRITLVGGEEVCRGKDSV